MTNCAYCHSPLPDGASFCSKCKAPVAPAASVSTKSGAAGNGKVKKLLLVVGATFLALVILSSLVSAIKSVVSGGDSAGTSAKGAGKSSIQVDKGIVPIFIGFDAFDSYSLAKKLGFSVNPYSLDGEYIYSYDVEYEKSLPGKSICYQSILPGSSYKQYDEIKLVIDASCVGQKPTMLTGAYAAQANLWTPAVSTGATAFENETLEGWVVGYNDEYSPESITLLTNFGEIRLSLGLIEPITNWCQDETFPGQDPALLALQAVKDTLPLYTPVRAVLGEVGRYDATFMHRLDSSGNLIDGPEPENSVNELLVETGYWIPDAVGIDESEMKIDPLKRKWLISKNNFLSPSELVYAKLIVAAANSLRLDKTNPLGICVAAEKVYWDKNYKDYYADLDSNTSSGGGVSTGGGGGCYVSGHWRAGHWVNGYYRNC